MFLEWTIGNFKSIAKPVSLRMAPLTVFVGANSSGKSTILQSILVLVQTLNSPTASRPFVLNGELIKLGSVSDILHRGNEDKPLEFGFALQINRNLLAPATSALSETKDSFTDRDATVRVYARCVPSTGSTGEVSYLTLDSASIEAENARIVIRQEQQANLPAALSIQGHTCRVLDLNYPPGKDRPLNPKEGLWANVVHFLPESLLEPYDARAEQLREALSLCEQYVSQREVPPWALNKLSDLRLDSPIGEEFRTALRSVFGPKMRRMPESQGYEMGWELLMKSHTAAEWLREAVMKLSPSTRVQIARELRPVTMEAPRRLKEDRRYRPDLRYRNQLLPEPMSSVRRSVVEHFTRGIWYLGPLRDNPRAIYELPPVPEDPDVGLRGEYTASVLQHHGADMVFCPLPGQSEFRSEQMSLREAVTRWLAHMGLVDKVSTSDRGKIGTELSLHLADVDKALDLTNVGIGVSQVLPSIVMGLLAPVGSSVLLEQPELHLHPRVQSILGDFMIGLARSGRQCIVETHSEYLINRLRRRIAEAQGDSLQRLIQIYFVERVDGCSTFRPVEPNEYGAIPDWPKGFFDQGPDEAQMIIQAATRKRQAKLEAGLLAKKGR